MAGGLFQCSHVPRHGNWIGNSAPPRSAIGEVPSIGIDPQAISTASKLHAAKASRVLEERKEENEKKGTRKGQETASLSMHHIYRTYFQSSPIQSNPVQIAASTEAQVTLPSA
ncbi:hypothetical protein V499_05504 [Pseudogymnoascus sp. VKM F-103]|nr:hypothetical protein V499_05504 [Pseudogymnoascus sp. VKM F-103]